MATKNRPFTGGSSFEKSPLTDSNRRPPPYHGGALPAELRGRAADCSCDSALHLRGRGSVQRLAEEHRAELVGLADHAVALPVELAHDDKEVRPRPRRPLDELVRARRLRG